MARILGEELGRFVQDLHEQHGVTFHLGRTAGEVGEATVTLDDGSVLDADLVVMGVGVRPRLDLARAIGLDVDNGIVADEYLATSVQGIWAAGDAVSWPDPRMGRIRVEHWVVAQRMGQTAARNLLGRRVAFTDVPFFWSQHYDVAIRYIGHGRGWDRAVVDGSVAGHDCLVTYLVEGVAQAVASIGRDRESLEAEVAMERGDLPALRRLTGT
jgi:NADPH-dependent 2,4-dienoyl-CoA reductase/sulfur reductase-like enzyme